MLWIPFRSDPNGRKISYRSAKPEWDTLLFHLRENFSLFRCVSGDSVDFGKFRRNQRIGRHAFWAFPLKKKNHCHWIFYRGDEKERAKKRKEKRRWWRHEAQLVWERKYKRRRRGKKRRTETEESTWATEDWWDVGTLEMRRRRRESGLVRWEVHSVGHAMWMGWEMGKV